MCKQLVITRRIKKIDGPIITKNMVLKRFETSRVAQWEKERERESERGVKWICTEVVA